MSDPGVQFGLPSDQFVSSFDLMVGLEMQVVGEVVVLQKKIQIDGPTCALLKRATDDVPALFSVDADDVTPLEEMSTHYLIRHHFTLTGLRERPGIAAARGRTDSPVHAATAQIFRKARGAWDAPSMSAIIVTCDRWLGLGAKYVVKVDGREVGRLGRRTKGIRTSVDAGSHEVSVEFNGNSTPRQTFDIAESEEVRLAVTFGSTRGLLATTRSLPWKERLTRPIGETPAGFMTLDRLNQASI